VPVLAFLLAAAFGGQGAAQTVPVQPSDEFRAVFGGTADIEDGKRLAQAACANCHGAAGVSGTQGVPHIAGQRPAYLFLELKAYQTGARPDPGMNAAVRFLSNDALVKAAAYYASLEPPQPAPSATPPGFDPVEAGKAGAAACGGCHGESGVSKIPGMPSLVGLDPRYLVAAMSAYKSGERKHAVMTALLAAIGDADIKNMALFYALQKPAKAETPSPGDASAGGAAAVACGGCHGDRGVSGNPATPSLAGQDAAYLVTATLAYRDGSRADPTMKALVGALDDATIGNLAAYYAGQEPQPPNVRKPLTTDEWAQRCDRCHGAGGNSTDPRIPALAGQRGEYLERALQAYRSRARSSPEMTAMSAVLTDFEIENLAAYYARQRARGVVYVRMPVR
jgi:cytochrome c553